MLGEKRDSVLCCLQTDNQQRNFKHHNQEQHSENIQILKYATSVLRSLTLIIIKFSTQKQREVCEDKGRVRLQGSELSGQMISNKSKNKTFRHSLNFIWNGLNPGKAHSHHKRFLKMFHFRLYL